MKHVSLSLLIRGAALLLCGSLHGQVLLTDTFDGSVIDSSKWSVLTSQYTPAGTAGAVYVSGGNAVLVNRGTIITKSEFRSSYELTGRFRIDGNIDRFGVWLRTTGTSTNPWKDQDNGVFINFQQETFGDTSRQWIGLNEWSVGGELNITAPYTSDNNCYLKELTNVSANIPSNAWLNFKIRDDGNNVSVYLNDLDNALFSVSTRFTPGSKVAFNNGYSNNQVSIDSITIVPETSSLAILALVGAMVLLGRWNR